jgi:cyanophycinase
MRTALSILLITLVTVVAALARGGDPPTGTVVAIGGGTLTDEILDVFVAAARGKDGGRIVVCPAASEQVEGPEVGRLTARGARSVEVVDFRSRAEADGPGAAKLENASGIFFTGGDQKRLLDTLRGSRALEAVRRAFRSGAAIAGTSAGCAVLGEVAITGDGEPDLIRAGATPTVEGLGFFSGVVLDQHFLARRRHNRLVSALLEKRTLVGIGVDERTALVRRGDGKLEVVGESFVSVYAPAKEGRAFALTLLSRGEKLDLAGR